MSGERAPLPDDILPRLARSRERLAAALAAIPAAERERAPGPGRWTAAGVLEHLALVEGWVTRLLERNLATAADDAALPPPAPLDGDALADRGRPIETVESARPTRGLGWEEAWRELASARERLVALIAATDAAALARVRAPHFVFGVLDGLDWIRFVAGHEERHALQIGEISAALGGRAGTAPAVVLDTNVVVAAAFRPGSHSARVVAAVRAGRLRGVWSDETRAETEHVVRKIPVLTQDALTGLFRDGDRWVPGDDMDAFESVADPEDRKFARLAAAARATLVTMDEHLLGVRGRESLTILTPGEVRVDAE